MYFLGAFLTLFYVASSDHRALPREANEELFYLLIQLQRLITQAAFQIVVRNFSMSLSDFLCQSMPTQGPFIFPSN